MSFSIRHHLSWLVGPIFSFLLIGSSKGDTDKLFVVDYIHHIIYMAEDVDGTFVNSVQTPLPLTGLVTPIGVDFDHRTEFVYWTDQDLHTVNRGAINGSYQEVIVQVSTYFGWPQGIALDLERDMVYWTDSFLKTIEMANLNGSERRVVVYVEQNAIPRGIVLSQKRGKLYWTDRGPYPKIEMANLDGSQREILISHDVADPNGIALDFAEKRLYFTDTTHDFVDSVDLDNTTDRIREIFVTNSSIDIFPFGVALYFEDLYFSDSNYDFIAESRANAGGIRFLNFTLGSPTEIHIYADTKCDSDYCLNAHSCKVVQRLPLIRECFCLPGFTGYRCQDVADPCVPDPCLNGGSCVTVADALICNCTTSYSGSLCETLLPCVINPCLNGGTCMADQSDSYTCSCPSGYFGNNCEQESNPCVSYPCNHGSCINQITSYVCNCIQSGGYTGDRCEIPPGPCYGITCLNGGICDLGQCDCPAPYSGSTCETYIDPCLNVDTMCLNGGNCTDLGAGNYLCSCPLEYTDSRCDVDVNECTEHGFPCKEKEICTNFVGGYNCTCQTDLEKINGICHAVTSIGGSLIISEVNGIPVTFTDALSIPTSMEYSILQRQSYDVIYNRIKRLLGTDLWRVVIIGFSQGSIVVNFEVKLFNLNQAILEQLAEIVWMSLMESVDDLWLSESSSVSFSVVSIDVYGEACLQSPCANGKCHSNVNDINYRCECTAGYTGTNCESRITCSQHPEPPFSHIVDPREAYYEDDLVEIICDDADGSVQWQCLANGEWNKTAMLTCDATGPDDETKNDLSLLPIVTVGVVAVVIIIAMLLFYFHKKNTRNSSVTEVIGQSNKYISDKGGIPNAVFDPIDQREPMALPEIFQPALYDEVISNIPSGSFYCTEAPVYTTKI